MRGGGRAGKKEGIVVKEMDSKLIETGDEAHTALLISSGTWPLALIPYIHFTRDLAFLV